jgi:hypothetical protein
LDSFDVTGFGDGVDLLLPFWCSDGFWVIGLIPWVQAFWELERLWVPSPGLFDCRRPESEPFRLAFVLKDCRPLPVFCEEGLLLLPLPGGPLAAGTELAVEAIGMSFFFLDRTPMWRKTLPYP